MKKILFAAGITIVGLSAAFAQEIKQTAPANTPTERSVSRTREVQMKATPEVGAQRRTDRLDAELTFTEAQKKKVYELFLKQSKDNQGRLVQSPELDAQLKAIFTAEQNKKYEVMKSERGKIMQRTMQSTRSSELKSPTAVK